MKRIIFVFSIILMIVACSKSPNRNATHQLANESITSCNFENLSISKMTDSVRTLWHLFQRTSDTTLLKQALSLNAIIALKDSTHQGRLKARQADVLFYKILGNKKEAFLASRRPLNPNDKLSWLIYKGLRYRVYGMEDSSEIQLNKVIYCCDSILADTTTYEYVMKKIAAYTIMRKKEACIKTLKESLFRVPKDSLLHINLELELDNLSRHWALSQSQIDELSVKK